MNLVSFGDISEIEKDIFLLRWIAVIGGIFLIPIADDVQTNSALAWAVILAGVLYNVLVGYFLFHRSYSVYLSYATSVADAFLLSMYISAYGSLMNEYAPIYLFSLLTVAMRFGFLETVLMGLADCLLYGAILLISGRPFSRPGAGHRSRSIFTAFVLNKAFSMVFPERAWRRCSAL